MKQPKDLIGRSTESTVALSELVCIAGGTARSSAPEFRALLGGSCEFPGARNLVIYSSPKTAGTMLDRCSAFCRALLENSGATVPRSWDRATLERLRWLPPASRGWRRKTKPIDRRLLDWKGAGVGRALWTLGGFEQLSWNWDRSALRERGDASSSQAASTKSQLMAHVEWDSGRREVDATSARVVKELIRLPMPMDGISRKRFEGLVQADLVQLKSLCGKAGVVSHGLLDSPYTKVARSLTLQSTAAETMVCLETRHTWFGIWRCDHRAAEQGIQA